jgi:hypothetical protein
LTRFDENGVPILELGHAAAAKTTQAQENLLSPDTETVYLTGAIVHLHNPRSRVGQSPDVTTFHIGGETLDEAAKSVIGTFEGAFGVDPPTWVASTDDDLAHVISDHYGCPVRGMDEELSA